MTLPRDFQKIYDQLCEDNRKAVDALLALPHTDFDAIGAFMIEMKKAEFTKKENRVLNVHTTPIKKKVKTKNGKPYEYFAAYLGNDKYFKCATYEACIEKLYEYYYPNEVITYKNPTIEELYPLSVEFLKEETRTSEHTILRREQEWNKYVAGTEFAKMRIKSVKASDVKSFYRHLSLSMTKKRFRNVRSVINTIFDIAVEKDIISVNYSRAVNINNFEFEREQTHYDEVYTKEEREKILTYLENRKNQTGYTRGIRLMFCFSCRLGEIKALTWDDVIETENGPMMYFRKQIVRRKCEDGHYHEVPLDYTKSRTASGDRMQPISERAMRVLDELRELGDTEGLICKNQRGKNLTTDRFNWVIKNACEATGVRYLSSHKMRFYSITEQVKAGKDISDIAYIAGHGSNFETTLGYIRQAHLNGQDLEEWEQIFG